MEDPKTFIGCLITTLPTPALVVSLRKVQENCERMRSKCMELGIRLRPHVKTHKTLEGALLQTGGRRSGIVVSTVAEAVFYAGHGFDDIVVGRPVTPHLLERCAALRRSVTSLHFLVNSRDGLRAVEEAGSVQNPVSALIKVSAGYERAGIPWDDTETIEFLAKKLSITPATTFQGIYMHCGNSYTTVENGVEEVRDVTVSRLLQVRDALTNAGINCLSVGIGSTPSCSLVANEKMSQLTEVHPGNYAFYDCQQESYGACKRGDIAARVMTRVVSHHPLRNQLLVDLGFTGLTKQGLDLAVPGYGAVDGHPNLKLVAMTQELGKIETVDGTPLEWSRFPVDTVLFIFPYHACATAGMYSHYYIHDAEGVVCDVWCPTRGW